MKYKSLIPDYNKLKKLTLERLYPELLEILSDISESKDTHGVVAEVDFIVVKTKSWKDVKIKSDGRIWLWSQREEQWQETAYGEITPNSCPLLDGVDTCTGRLTSIEYIEELIKHLDILKNERAAEMKILEKNINILKTLPGIATRKIIIEKSNDKSSKYKKA